MKDSEKTTIRFMYVIFFTGIVAWIAFVVYIIYQFWELITSLS